DPQPIFDWYLLLHSSIAFAIARPIMGSVSTPHVPSGAIATTVMSFGPESISVSVLALGGTLSSAAGHPSDQRSMDIVAANTAMLLRRSMITSPLRRIVVIRFAN